MLLFELSQINYKKNLFVIEMKTIMLVMFFTLEMCSTAFLCLWYHTR